jgi:hypothetical protein
MYHSFYLISLFLLTLIVGLLLFFFKILCVFMLWLIWSCSAGFRFIRCEASWICRVWVRLLGGINFFRRYLCQRNTWKNKDNGMFTVLIKGAIKRVHVFYFTCKSKYILSKYIGSCIVSQRIISFLKPIPNSFLIFFWMHVFLLTTKENV